MREEFYLGRVIARVCSSLDFGFVKGFIHSVKLELNSEYMYV